jgi:uncharacterized protein
MAAPDDLERLSWEQFGVAVQELGRSVLDRGFRPELLLAIARGGLPVAGALGYVLGTKSCGVINVEYYTGVDERLDVPIVLPPPLDLEGMAQAQVLVVDDVADTGDTLALVVEQVRPRVGDLRTAVLYEKPRSVVRCDFVWRTTERWIEFPWSSHPPVGGPTPG